MQPKGVLAGSQRDWRYASEAGHSVLPPEENCPRGTVRFLYSPGSALPVHGDLLKGDTDDLGADGDSAG